jgi:hypothetical protein
LFSGFKDGRRNRNREDERLMWKEERDRELMKRLMEIISPALILCKSIREE